MGDPLGPFHTRHGVALQGPIEELSQPPRAMVFTSTIAKRRGAAVAWGIRASPALRGSGEKAAADRQALVDSQMQV